MNAAALKHVLVFFIIPSLASAGDRASALSFTVVEAGQLHTCALSDQQQVWCWGKNEWGVLGIGQAPGISVRTPRPVALAGVTKVAAGNDHMCAIAGGRAFCWGSNLFGQLGIGELKPDSFRGMPVEVGGELAGRTDVTAISAGFRFSCAVAGGETFCWGWGDAGQRGDGSNEPVQPLPALVQLADASDVVAGGAHACAIAPGSQGGAWCWGKGTSGALGQGAYASSNVPVAVQGIPINVERLTTGFLHSCAAAAGFSWCWGNGEFGVLGTGSVNSRNFPAPIEWNPAVQSAIVDVDGGGMHTCALAESGRAWCWGHDGSGQLGNDLARQDMWEPVPVAWLEHVTSISTGYEHSCAIAEGVAHCWGNNAFGQLGTLADLPYAQVPIPVNVDRVFDSGFDP